MRRTIHVVGAFIVSLLLAGTVQAVMVMPLDVEEMTQRAEKIFVGTCTKVEPSVNVQGMPIVTVTFAVSEPIKGAVGSTVTFRQLDPTPRPQTNPQVRGVWSALSLANVPAYAPGEEALLFLSREGKIGISAPIGLFQGKLPVSATAAGEKVITNHALKQMTGPQSPIPAPGKTAAYGAFVAAIRAMAKPAR